MSGNTNQKIEIKDTNKSYIRNKKRRHEFRYGELKKTTEYYIHLISIN